MAQVNTNISTETVEDFDEFFGGVDADNSVVTTPTVLDKTDTPTED